MLPLALACLVAVGPAQDTARASSQDSPLVERSAACARGVALLGELRDHLVPPRNRTELTIEVDAQAFAHSARPDLHARRRVERTIRIHEVGWSEGVARWEIFGEERDRGREETTPRPIAVTWGGVGPREERSPSEELRLRLSHYAPFPHVAIAWIVEHGRVADVLDRNGRTDVLVDVPGGRVLARTVELDHGGASAPGLVGLDWWTHDVLLGDVVDSLEYGDAHCLDPGVACTWRIEGPCGTDEHGVVMRAVDSDVARPLVGYAPSDGFPSAGDVEVRVAPISERLTEVRLPQYDARVLALDLDGAWCVLEAPVGSHVGEAIVRALDAEHPGRPFAYVAVSHHHPHYVGALRPFVARGATVVCPKAVSGYVRDVLERPRTIHPDRLARSPQPIEIVGIPRGEVWSPLGQGDRLVAVEADGRSSHTDAFLAFFLPDERLGFGGDLLWIPADPDVRRRSPRTTGLHAVIEESGVEIDAYLTSWPVTCDRIGGLAWREQASIDEIRDVALR